MTRRSVARLARALSATLVAAAAFGTVALVPAVFVPAAAAAHESDPEPTTPGAQPSAPVTLADELASAASTGARGADELSAAVGIGARGQLSLLVNEAGELVATVTFDAAPTPAQRDQVARIARIDKEFRMAPALSVVIDPARLTELSAIAGVVSVEPAQRPLTRVVPRSAEPAPSVLVPLAAPPTGCRTIVAEGAAPMLVDTAWEKFQVDGSGVTIGIISDSYALETAITTPQQDVEAGLLPGPGNPCGYLTPVTVIAEADPLSGGDDEGRAMAQLAHSIAPGARLLFATAGSSPADMMDNIGALALAGADIIVDDITFPSETYFQRGLISYAIDYVRESHGVAYYSSAGNSTGVGAAGTASEDLPISGWQTQAYRPASCADWVQTPETFGSGDTYDCLDFDPGPDVVPFDSLVFGETPATTFLLNWGESTFGRTTELVLQAYRVEPGGARVLTGESSLLTAAMPIAQLGVGYSAGEYSFVVVRKQTPDAATPAVWLGILGNADGLQSRRFDRSSATDTVGPVGLGHNIDGSATSVAAADWTTPDEPERFTSLGPATLLFEPLNPLVAVPSPAYPSPLTVHEPTIAAVDGTATNFFGGADGSVYRFYGTSAAAPHMAAVHALALERAPGTSSDEVIAALGATGRAMSNPFAAAVSDDSVFGAGMVDAEALVGRMPAPAVPSVSAAAAGPTGVSARWGAVPGATGYVVHLLQGGALVESAEVGPDARAAEFTGLQPGTAYALRVFARNDVGASGVSGATVSVATAAEPGTTGGGTGTAASVSSDAQTRSGQLAVSGSEGPSIPVLAAAFVAALVGAGLLIGRPAPGRRDRSGASAL